MEQLYYPMEWLGNTLRDMSLSGNAGNIAAFAIYIIISAMPCLLYLMLKVKKKSGKSDLLLPILSVVLFITIYYLINPTLFMADADINMPEISVFMLISLFYSLLAGYLILRGMEYCMSSGVTKLQKGIKTVLYMMTVFVILAIANECLFVLPEAIQTLKEGNTSSGMWNEFFVTAPDLTLSIVFIAMQSLVKIVPYVFDVAIIIMVIKLIRELETDRYSEKVTGIFEKLSKVCTSMLVCTVGSNIAINVLQVLFRNKIYKIHMDISIPILSIAFVLAVLLITRYVYETQKMKEELDMFI